MSEPFDYGHFDIVLADYLRVNGISKNQLSDKANLQRTQLNSYCNHVRQIAIPLLKDRAVQKHINELALGANKKRYEAYCLEQEALRIMNEEVILAK